MDTHRFYRQATIRREVPLTLLLLLLAVAPLRQLVASDDLPLVADDLAVTVFADESLVSNPCAITFDDQGRLCVGMGPQWRAPSPETPGDSVFILIDSDGDGKADTRKQFATGFNCIQGLVWRGQDLWVANSPELTIVRDLDGDDVADEYVRLYTDLGNLEHSLHGLNVGPDGMVYMSKGNSKGMTKPPHRVAPKPFRELWGVTAPEGTPDLPEPVVFKAGNYQKNYHPPQDDWGRHGGILRCRPDGSGLEIFSRGFRNPFDITFDSSFNWFGTDNDQTYGDKMFAPFYGSHFGWGHRWSFNWEGKNHLPTVPASGPLFEGSGAGVIYVAGDGLGPACRDTFLVTDWMAREVRIFRPTRNGAHLVPDREKLEVLISAGTGRSMAMSEGKAFDPVDLEIGPDGALFISSWGREYGGVLKEGKQVNAGRIYRLQHRQAKLAKSRDSKHVRPLSRWTVKELVANFESTLPIWRSNAQEELVRRGPEIVDHLTTLLQQTKSTQAETWLLWTIGRIDDWQFPRIVSNQDAPFNHRLQAIRILAHRANKSGAPLTPDFEWPDDVRLRFEMAVAVREAGSENWVPKLVELAAIEKDRLTFYATWGAMMKLMETNELVQLLSDKREGVRKASLLALVESGKATPKAVKALAADSDQQVAALANSWLQANGIGVDALITTSTPAGDFADPFALSLTTHISRGLIRYTLDGSVPGGTSPAFKSPIPISSTTTIRAILIKDNVQMGPVYDFNYTRIKSPPHAHIGRLKALQSDRRYSTGTIRDGATIYTDRPYLFREVPALLNGLPVINTPNNDCDSRGEEWLRLDLTWPATVYLGHDTRAPHLPNWIEQSGFQKTDLFIGSNDPLGMTFQVFKKEVESGSLILGGNTNDGDGSRRGNYVVIIDPRIIEVPTTPTTLESVRPLLAEADPARGRDLFLSKQGAGCYACHQMEGIGNIFAPDLADVGTRADADFLIESILNPSAAITEGFALQVISTKHGETHGGMVVEETTRAVKLVMADGSTVTIPANEIASRAGSHTSPMPPFAGLLGPQEVADLAVYLMSRKPGFSFRRESAGKLELALDGRRFATYLLEDDTLTRRAFVNMTTPSGIPVTRRFPPRKPEDLDPGYGGEQGIIHPVMHPGLWMSFGWIDGNDYWRLQSEVVFEKFLKEPDGDRDEATFTTRDRYLDKEGRTTICWQDTQYRFRRVPQGIVLDWDAEFYNDTRDVLFGDQEESGLAIRVASPLRVQGGNGKITNDRGEENGAGTWGKPFNWVDYSGVIEGKQAGLLIIPHPDNPRQSWSHSRDYGVLVANPFPKQPKERREPYLTTTVKKGERLRLRYTILIHESEAGTFDPAQVVKEIFPAQE